MNHHQKILIVESQSHLRTKLFRLLNRKGFQVITAHSQSQAQSLAGRDLRWDIAIINGDLLGHWESPDHQSSINETNKFLCHLESINPELGVIVLFDSQKNFEKVSTKGYHIIHSPFFMEKIVQTVENMISKILPQPSSSSSQASSPSQKKNSQLQLQEKYKFEDIIGQSLQIKKLLELVEKISDSDSTVLVTGESGTGKELVAKAIHFNSPRSKSAFVPINCGAIPSELLESELFGHVKGAFTNAISNRMGRFELAEGGTIFFDEIGDMSPHLQVKLLRVLQERTFEPIGSTKTLEANVRVIAATNIHLEKAVQERKFREDLYYRLNVIPVNIPSLKERQEDIPILFHHFMQKFNKNRSKKITGITPEALQVLCQHKWPGNIRELENLIERLSILKGGGLIELSDLPSNYRYAMSSIKSPLANSHIEMSEVGVSEVDMDFNSAVDAYENALIMRALEKTGWNRNQAAILLKLNRTTLVEKIKKKGLKPSDKLS